MNLNIGKITPINETSITQSNQPSDKDKTVLEKKTASFAEGFDFDYSNYGSSSGTNRLGENKFFQLALVALSFWFFYDSINKVVRN